MAQLWGGRFTKQTDQLVFDFNASITFDKRLFHEDVTGSIVHATMLAKQGILTEEERKSIVEGLTGILEDVDDGTLAIDEISGRHSQFRGGYPDRPDRRCREKASHGQKP